jgi:site-specific DNA-methyltransferase (adenine-specific)
MRTNIIYTKDCRHMDEVPDGSVQLIVTSPPYNVGKPYDGHYDNMELEEYLAFLEECWRECIRVLCRGGRLCVNVASTGRKPYIPLHAYIAIQLIELGLEMRGEIIWDKGSSVGVSTAWGSFARASNPTLRDVHEYILVFSKETPQLLETHGAYSGIRNDQFVEWTKSIWRFKTESSRRFDHPAVFPEELPRRLILLYTNVHDIVLDPFMGTGTTAVAALKLGRRYIGYEISPTYVEIARQRLEEARQQLEEEARLRRLREEGVMKDHQYVLPGFEATPAFFDPYEDDERRAAVRRQIRRNGRKESIPTGLAGHGREIAGRKIEKTNTIEANSR